MQHHVHSNASAGRELQVCPYRVDGVQSLVQQQGSQLAWLQSERKGCGDEERPHAKSLHGRGLVLTKSHYWC